MNGFMAKCEICRMSSTRINLAPGPSGYRVVLSQAQKDLLEACYGHKLSPDLWEEIIAVTDELTVDGPLGASAAFYDKTLEKLYELADLARALLQYIDPRKVDGLDLTTEEIWYAFFHRRKKATAGSRVFLFLLEVIEPLIALSNFAKRCAVDPTFGTVPKGTDDRWHWEYWIVSLWKLFERHGLPVAARKDFNKRNLGSTHPSLFFL